MNHNRGHSLRRAAVALAVGAGLAAASLAAASPASAATLNVVYPVHGTTLVAKPNSTVKLGPSKLNAALTTVKAGSLYTIKASLPLPPAQSSFSIGGLIPVTATVNFIPVGDVTGKITQPNGKNYVTSTATYTLRLSDVTAAGLPAMVGDTCETTDPVTIPVHSAKGQDFNVIKGGTLKGTYTIGDFQNCGLTTTLINQQVPGSGNTVSLTLGKAKFTN